MKSSQISIIVAMAKNRVIGKNNALPWHLSPDLKHFKSLTMGHAIIMGRKTYESIGKPLPGRTSVIVTRQPGYQVPGAIVAGSVDEALQACNEYAESFVIGGAEVYRQTLEHCQRMYITELQWDFDGDAFFPEFSHDQWRETSREKHRLDDGTELEYHFVVLDRKT